MKKEGNFFQEISKKKSFSNIFLFLLATSEDASLQRFMTQLKKYVVTPTTS